MQALPRQEHSIRKEETKRKRERAAKKEREAAEKQRKREELLRLKALKRQELNKKLELIQQVAGKADLRVDDLDMEEDFDSDAHDRRMVSHRDARALAHAAYTRTVIYQRNAHPHQRRRRASLPCTLRLCLMRFGMTPRQRAPARVSPPVREQTFAATCRNGASLGRLRH
jgi:hypothetical protein